MKNRPLAPGFLKKLDEKWMKKHPVLWSSRIHWVLYYGILVLIPVFIIALPVYFPLTSGQSTITGSMLISVISLICAIFWLRYLFRFNPFKRFSISGKADTLKTFGLYFFTFCFFFSWILIPVFTSYLGTSLRFSRSQILADSRNLNESVAGEVYHKSPAYFTPEKEYITISRKDSFQTIYTRGHEQLDTITFEEQLSNLKFSSDSLVRENDTTFIRFTFPDFNFIRAYGSYEYGKNLYKMDLYHKITSNPKSYEEYHAITTRIVDKYQGINYNEYSDYYGYDGPVDYADTYNDEPYINIERTYKNKYALKSVEYTMNHINHKLEFREDLGIYFRLIYYFAMTATLLLFIFRHTSGRALFLSLLSAFVLFLVTMIFFMAVKIHDKEPLFIYILYEVAFMIIGLAILGARKKNILYVIGLNIFVLGLTMLPLVAVTLVLGDNFRERDFLLPCEIAGFLLQVLAVIFLYRPLYRKWYALPDE